MKKIIWYSVNINAKLHYCITPQNIARSAIKKEGGRDWNDQSSWLDKTAARINAGTVYTKRTNPKKRKSITIFIICKCLRKERGCEKE